MRRKEAAAEHPTAEPQVNCLCMGMGPKVTSMLSSKPGPALDHLRNARVEILKAIRSLIDERIEHLSRSERKGTTVIVE